MIHETLKTLTVPIDSIVPYDRNPRRGVLALIAESLNTNGQYRPIVVNKRSNQILAGNHTYLAAKDLGWEHIAATFVDVDEATAQRIVLVDNRSNDVATYNDDELLELLKEVNAEVGLIGTGFTDDDLDELISELGQDVDLDWTDEPAGDRYRSMTLIFPSERFDQVRDALREHVPDDSSGHMSFRMGAALMLLLGVTDDDD